MIKYCVCIFLFLCRVTQVPGPGVGVWIECWERDWKGSKVVSAPGKSVDLSLNTQGTVDEESFIQQFQAPGSILVLSRKDLDLQLASVYTSLSSREWRRRVEVRIIPTNTHPIILPLQALQLLRALLTGGAGAMEEFPGRLKYLELPFELCVKDLRSQVRFLHPDSDSA